MKAKGDTNPTVPRTKLKMKKIRWNRDNRLVKLDDLPSVNEI